MRLKVLVFVVALLASAACGRGETTPLAGGEPATHTPRPRPLPPPASSSADVNPSSQSGQQVFITAKGARPEFLFSVIGETISFINETDEPVTVRFTVLGFTTGAIAPGGRRTYTPRSAESIVYELVERPRVKGRIQVGPYFDPGEDPAADRRLDADTPGESRRNQVWR